MFKLDDKIICPKELPVFLLFFFKQVAVKVKALRVEDTLEVKGGKKKHDIIENHSQEEGGELQDKWNLRNKVSLNFNGVLKV